MINIYDSNNLKKNRTKPKNADVIKAKNDGFKLGKYWNAYSNEVRIHIFTSNFNELVKFYNKILEFPIVKKFNSSNSTGVLIDIGGNIIEIFSKTKNSSTNGKISLSLRVNDIEKKFEQYSSKNISIGELTKNSWGDTSFDVIDPDGNRITLFSIDENRNKYYKVKYE